MVELPLTTAGEGTNVLTFCAVDFAGNPLGTPAEPCVSATVTRQSPLVEARIAEPAASPVTARPGSSDSLDGSESLFPEGGVALWTTGRGISGNVWGASFSTPTSDPMDLMTQTVIPEGSAYGFRARLVVAASLEDLPSDLWPNSGDLPCATSRGRGPLRQHRSGALDNLQHAPPFSDLYRDHEPGDGRGSAPTISSR